MFKRFKSALAKSASEPLDPPGPPVPAKPAPLDHTAYPHILSIVLLHAPHASLLRLRSTCRSLRDRVDRAMAVHMIYLGDEKHARVPLGHEMFQGGLIGTNSRHPAFAPLSPPRQPSALRRMLGRVPPLPALPTPARQLELLAAAHVIDLMFTDLLIVDGLSCDLVDAAKRQQLHLRAVRMWWHDMLSGGRPSSLPVETRVVFWWQAPIAPPPGPVKNWRCMHCTAGSRRTVLNCSVRDRDLGAPPLWWWMAESRELVIVLVDRDIPATDRNTAPSGEAFGSAPPSMAAMPGLSTVFGPSTPAIDLVSEPSEQPTDSILCGILNDIVCPFFCIDPSVSSVTRPLDGITIVNADVLAPLDTARWKLFFPELGFPGVRDALQPYETLESLVACLTAMLGTPAWPLSFLTLEEYRAQVGLEQFRLETDENFVLQAHDRG